MPAIPQKRRFSFTVDDTGKFTYDPPGNWLYYEADDLDFVSPSGKFHIEFYKNFGPADPAFNPLQGPLTASQVADGTWVAKTKVKSGLSAANRKAIYDANKTETAPGFISQYNYRIDIGTPKGNFRNADHNGIFGC